MLGSLIASIQKTLSDPYKMNPYTNLHINTRAFSLSNALLLPPGVSKYGQGVLYRRSSAVINTRGFLCSSGSPWVKKLVQGYRLRLATWKEP